MKKLKVPYLNSLDALDLSSISYVMEFKAQREYIDSINWADYPYKPLVAFDIARSSSNLYIRFLVREASVKAIYTLDNSPVHRDSCVEFFMKKVEDTEYMNFEFNSIGTCDASRRESREIKNSLSPDEYKSIRRLSSIKAEAFAEIPGVCNWELLISIPFSLLGLDPQNLPEKIQGNFYKCADETLHPHYASWSPIALAEPNFHCPDFFGEIYF